MRVCTFVLVVFLPFIMVSFSSSAFPFTRAHFFHVSKQGNFSLCYDKLPRRLRKQTLDVKNTREIESMHSTKKGKKKESNSWDLNNLPFIPFTQDSAVVYSLTGEAKWERPVIKIKKKTCFYHDWPFRALLEACLPMMKKIPRVLLP